jgi:hypothetical protein
LSALPPVVVSGLPNITPIFIRIWLMKITMQFDREIDEVSLRIAWLISRAWTPTEAVAHVAFELGLGGQRGDRVDDDHRTAPERTSVSVISSACSPVSGCEISSSSRSTPSLRA